MPSVTHSQHMETRRLSTTEAAKRLGYSDDKIRRMCEAGKFPNAARDGSGGHWRVPESDLAAFLEANKPRVLRRPKAA